MKGVSSISDIDSASPVTPAVPASPVSSAMTISRAWRNWPARGKSGSNQVHKDGNKAFVVDVATRSKDAVVSTFVRKRIGWGNGVFFSHSR